MYKGGLVLEGGGMRGVYTAGVLDFFIDKDIYFENTYGVSAGICHACSYLAKQRDRAYRVNVDYLDDKRYASFYSLVTTGDYFGVKMVYEDIPNKLYPFDKKTFEEYEGNLYSVVTNMKTGEAEYIKLKDMDKDIIYVRASSSLPLLSRIVKVDGKEYLDGGIADSIPIEKAIKDGNEKNVVVLTQPNGYRKEKNKLLPVMKIKYKKYPNFINSMANRHINYNNSLDKIKEEEEKGNVFVIRPSESLDITRLEKNKYKLEALYNLGYNDAKKAYNKLLNFISN
ncbi:patatin family protein [Anaerofustis butyriciformans]|uniref:patatin-like phospholipase family protein n=1 Tax=Anaerofustis butyriciformans TaxID=3108533 RepID=UPI002E33ABF2|nr:patatin family protein [Anaerofustis sp. HA2171]